MKTQVKTDAAGSGGSGGLLTLDEGRHRILSQLVPVALVERVAVSAALDRILGEAIVSPVDVPAHANSAMDGYALRATDLPHQEGRVPFPVVGDAFAGHPFSGLVGPGECVRIMTGGVMPAGADTVVAWEDTTELAGGRVGIGPGHRPGQHVRKPGEDLSRGMRVLEAGRRLAPADLGLIASLGIVEVAVRRRLRVAFFSTGDELRSLGEPLGEGDIYDSNRHTLRGMLARIGADVLDLGVVRDRPEDLRRALTCAAADADVVITTGGVSVGAADYVKDVLAEVGAIDFWKLNIKPGKPMAFGRLNPGAVFFGLAGNPVSTMVTFYQVVQPALDCLAGAGPRLPLLMRARTSGPLRKVSKLREYQRGILEPGPDGAWTVRSAAPQGSGILRSMSLANCFIILPEDCRSVEPGTEVRVQPFAGLV